MVFKNDDSDILFHRAYSLGENNENVRYYELRAMTGKKYYQDIEECTSPSTGGQDGQPWKVFWRRCPR